MKSRQPKKKPSQGKVTAPAKAKPEASDANSMKRGAISAFIVFHLVAITCWAVPWSFAPLGQIREIVRPYMQWTGLFQSWNIFAPNPDMVNSYVRGVVITRDRHMRVMTFPRMEELSFAERYRKERFRKYTEVLPEQGESALWPDAAQHVAWLFNNPSDPPDQVLLIQFHSDIEPGASEEPEPKPDVFYDQYLPVGGVH